MAACVTEEGRRVRDVRETCDRSDPGHMAVVADCPPDVAKYANEHAEREGESVFGLVDASVEPRHPDDPPVVEWTRGDEGKDDHNYVPDICQALDNML